MVTILSLLGSSKGERISVDAVVRGANRLLDDGQTAGFAEGAPCARGGAGCFRLGDLFDRSAFDERTGAEAISHGETPAAVGGRRRRRAVRGGLSPPATCMLFMIRALVSPIKRSTEAIKLAYQLSS